MRQEEGEGVERGEENVEGGVEKEVMEREKKEKKKKEKKEEERRRGLVGIMHINLQLI